MTQQRIEQLKKQLVHEQVDSILVSYFHNIIYLSEFKTLSPSEREGFLLITPKSSYLFTDARYFQNLKFQILNFKSRLLTYEKNLLHHLKEISEEEHIKSIGFEAEDLKYFEYEQLEKTLRPVTLRPLDRCIIQQRAIKDNKEIEKITKACELTDTCLEEITPMIKEGMTEKEIAWKLEYWIREKGYELAFDPIVASDANAALPHYNTKMGDGVIKKGAVILIDFGIKYDDYISDITRMFFYGTPSDEVRNIYTNLQAVQQSAGENVILDMECKSVDSSVREDLKNRNLPSMPHSTGHGVGLEVHEYPKVSYVSTDVFKNGHVFTIEPGVYYPDKFGMRIEDTVALIDGKLQVLTHFKKDMAIL